MLTSFAIQALIQSLACEIRVKKIPELAWPCVVVEPGSWKSCHSARLQYRVVFTEGSCAHRYEFYVYTTGQVFISSTLFCIVRLMCYKLLCKMLSFAIHVISKTTKRFLSLSFCVSSYAGQRVCASKQTHSKFPVRAINLMISRTTS